MQYVRGIAGFLLALGYSLASATTTLVTDRFTLEYDESTSFAYASGLFDPGGSAYGFSWTVSDSVHMEHLRAPGPPAVVDTVVFDLPSFTLTANPGWVLSGPITSFLGNLSYTELGPNLTTTVKGVAFASIDGGAVFQVGGKLTQHQTFATTVGGVPYASGYFAGTGNTFSNGFTSLSLGGGTLTLEGRGVGFSTISAQPQNKLEFTLLATPVPEPAEWAMLLAGLGMVGWVAVRRRENRG